MITSIAVYTQTLSSSWTLKQTFTLANPTNEMAIINVAGIDSVEADFSEIEYATIDGTIAGRRKLPSRNIEITIVPYFASDAQAVRYNISKIFPVKKKIKLVITSPNRVVETEGVVVYNEFTTWGSDPQVVVHIVCPDPYMYNYSSDTSETNQSKTGSLFEYDFSNESLTENLLEFEEVVAAGDKWTYNGDIDIGFIMNMNVTAATDTILVMNSTTGEGLSLDGTVVNTITGSSFKNGDKITLDTRPGQKSVILNRTTDSTQQYVYDEALRTDLSDGTTDWNIIGSVEIGAIWPKLSVGENHIGVAAENTNAGAITWTLTYTEAYEGA